ncbi:M50 family metallopeptidase [Selenomonadales bacterium OttesenSCG-928-I06]|nr:M50 family metallopeptidase [Selenomonadales bacterium OttesenSCG-928-I06]
MKAGKVAGVKLILNNWFLLLIVLFSVAGLLDKVILVFSAVIFHELAHIITAANLGYNVKEIELLPFGAVAKIEGISTVKPAVDIMISIAGPLFNIGLSLILYIFIVEEIYLLDKTILNFYLKVNLVLAAFNLLPALPLDGGRILRAILALKTDYKKATEKVVALSYIVCIFLSLTFGLQYYLYGSLNMTLLVAAIFIFVKSKKEITIANFRSMHLAASKKSLFLSKKILPVAQLIAGENIYLKDIIKSFKAEEYNIVILVDENLNLKQTFTETQVLEGLTEMGIKTKIKDLI